MPDNPQPQNLQDLSAWIAGTSPYHNLNHATAEFPDVNDFLIRELETALLKAVTDAKVARERLRNVPGPHQAFLGCAELAVSSSLIHRQPRDHPKG